MVVGVCVCVGGGGGGDSVKSITFVFLQIYTHTHTRHAHAHMWVPSYPVFFLTVLCLKRRHKMVTFFSFFKASTIMIQSLHLTVMSCLFCSQLQSLDKELKSFADTKEKLEEKVTNHWWNPWWKKDMPEKRPPVSKTLQPVIVTEHYGNVCCSVFRLVLKGLHGMVLLKFYCTVLLVPGWLPVLAQIFLMLSNCSVFLPGLSWVSLSQGLWTTCKTTFAGFLDWVLCKM